MHPATVQPPPSPPSSAETLEEITQIMGDLLPSTITITCFASRWQVIRSRLDALKSHLSQISGYSHWSENPLLPPLLAALLSTLRRTENLCRRCLDDSFASRGKLLMQSDLDMAAGWLSKQANDLELLLRSGVLHHSTAIVLCRPVPSSSRDELVFFVKDLFTRLQIGGLEFKRKALDSLIHLLSEDDKSAAVVAREGNIGCLISLLDPNSHDSLTESAVHAIYLLAASGDLPRRCVFEEGALGPLLKTIDCSSATANEKAAMAVEILTIDADNAWAISAHSGVPILIELCKSASPATQSHAIGAIRNVSVVEDIRIALAEEGAIPVLMQLLVTGNASTQAKAANCISILASTGDHFRSLLLQENGLNRLLNLFHECPTADTLEHVLSAISSLSASDSNHRILSASTQFIVQIGEIIKHGTVKLQHISASLLAKLSICDGDKILIAGCMNSLVKLMESVKPEGIQEIGAKVLVSLLSVKSNRKELVKDGKSLTRLVQLLDPKNGVVVKKFPVAVVVAVMAGGSKGCRKRLLAGGVYEHLQRLAEADIAGAKKALHRLSGSRLASMLSRAWKD